MRSWRRLAVTTLMVGAAAVMLTACSSSGQSSTVAEGGSCAAQSAAVHLAHARIVFVGTALPGPVSAASLTSPARFRVDRYLKGGGPAVVTVETAVTSRGNGTVYNEDGIQPRAGQRWTIYTSSLRTPYQTSLCGGSCVMGGSGDDVNVPCGKA